jgi:hypothetical protein
MQEIHDENEQTGETNEEKERWSGDRDRGGWCSRGDEASPHNFHLNFEEQGDDGRPFWGWPNFRLAWSAGWRPPNLWGSRQQGDWPASGDGCPKVFILELFKRRFIQEALSRPDSLQRRVVF